MERFDADTEGITQRLRDGTACAVPSFPLTGFRGDGGLDLESYTAYLTVQVATAPGAVEHDGARGPRPPTPAPRPSRARGTRAA
ncbi:hypothetical protein [Streptomyces sp. NPDC014623]|uniref:hypothetical protein n=1 Tax=Streptomyces sp. NPDC014623 TaxID=3364875 RepID=UPI0036F93DD4